MAAKLKAKTVTRWKSNEEEYYE